jgi:hypothetical protein
MIYLVIEKSCPRRILLVVPLKVTSPIAALGYWGVGVSKKFKQHLTKTKVSVFRMERLRFYSLKPDPPPWEHLKLWNLVLGF